MIRDIFLRNFNKYPNFYIKTNLAIFIEEIALKAQEIYTIYMPLLKQMDFNIRTIKSLETNQNKLIDRNFCLFLTLISGLLLSIEQYIYNKTNPQIAFTTNSFVLMNAEESHYSQDGQKPLENSKFISEEALTNIVNWLDMLFIDETPIYIK